jgi:hypothetical protein
MRVSEPRATWKHTKKSSSSWDTCKGAGIIMQNNELCAHGLKVQWGKKRRMHTCMYVRTCLSLTRVSQRVEWRFSLSRDISSVLTLLATPICEFLIRFSGLDIPGTYWVNFTSKRTRISLDVGLQSFMIASVSHISDG